jgi:hypothetical protein
MPLDDLTDPLRRVVCEPRRIADADLPGIAACYAADPEPSLTRVSGNP